MSEELLPCPFCGRVPTVNKYHTYPREYKIECADAKCFAYVCAKFGALSEAIIAWNTRYDNQSKQAERKELFKQVALALIQSGASYETLDVSWIEQQAEAILTVAEEFSKKETK